MITSVNKAEYYFGFLKNLEHDSKLDLISKLSESLKSGEHKNEISLQSLFGAYKTDQSADDIIQEIRKARCSNRKTEEL
jgi:tRNA A-37 threonylcarbamoyl transferase component Bud32